jgi:hypothetical protein
MSHKHKCWPSEWSIDVPQYVPIHMFQTTQQSRSNVLTKSGLDAIHLGGEATSRDHILHLELTLEYLVFHEVVAFSHPKEPPNWLSSLPHFKLFEHSLTWWFFALTKPIVSHSVYGTRNKSSKRTLEFPKSLDFLFVGLSIGSLLGPPCLYFTHIENELLFVMFEGKCWRHVTHLNHMLMVVSTESSYMQKLSYILNLFRSDEHCLS